MTAKAAARVQACELVDQLTDVRCERPATAFAMGRHYCAGHDPKGSTACTHSLAPSGRCAYCGARTEGGGS